MPIVGLALIPDTRFVLGVSVSSRKVASFVLVAEDGHGGRGSGSEEDEDG